MSDNCDDCDRPIYDYLDFDEQARIDSAGEHDKYCCSEKGYPDPNCLEIKNRKRFKHHNAADALIEMLLPKCEHDGCDQYATIGLNGYACINHMKGPQGFLSPEQAKQHEEKYSEALREYLIAKEKNGRY